MQVNLTDMIPQKVNSQELSLFTKDELENVINKIKDILYYSNDIFPLFYEDILNKMLNVYKKELNKRIEKGEY